MAERRRLLVAACLASMLAAPTSGCEEGPAVRHPDPHAELDALEDPDTAPAKPVATVDGRSISRGELEDFWRQHPELGRREALDALVERELLVAHARRAGDVADIELDRARKRGLVRALLDAEVRAAVDTDSLDKKELAERSEAIRSQLRRPAGYRASHLLVRIPPDEGRSEAERSELERRARRAAEEISERLGARIDDLDPLYEALEAMREEVEPPLQLVVNVHLKFPAQAEVEAGASGLPDDWQKVVPPFARTTASLAGRGPGAVGDPVRTEFGFHVIVFEESYEARAPDEEEVARRAERELLEESRRARLLERLGGLLERATILQFPEALDDERPEE
jgi:hypothetical protein